MVRWTDRHALGKESLLLLLWRRRTSDDRARKKKERVRIEEWWGVRGAHEVFGKLGQWFTSIYNIL